MYLDQFDKPPLPTKWTQVSRRHTCLDTGNVTPGSTPPHHNLHTSLSPMINRPIEPSPLSQYPTVLHPLLQHNHRGTYLPLSSTQSASDLRCASYAKRTSTNMQGGSATRLRSPLTTAHSPFVLLESLVQLSSSLQRRHKLNSAQLPS
ncbi:hypothetical protein BJ165DRAFT_1452564 [Panaeolus papilionaceus]|nr:hypothetical protein BJ165DRAFT_1452564 [Panaeolus papilionaceus]